MASPDSTIEAPIAYVLGTFPQASQTFIAREVRGLLRTKTPLRIYSLKRGAAAALETPDREWFDQVVFAPRAFAPGSISALLWWLRRDAKQLRSAFRTLFVLPHRPRALRLRTIPLMAQAAWIARHLAESNGCRSIHAHFALAQTEVAIAVGVLVGRPFSFTAHARDIYASPSALPEKMRAARLVVTCTGYNAAYLRNLCPDLPTDHVRLVHHGVEIGHNPPGASTHTRESPAPPLILAAGRLIEKKGFDDLISACERLRDRGLAFRCVIAGNGPLRRRLLRLVHDAKLEHQVELPGWLSAAAVADTLRTAAMFAMPSRIAPKGDRDGIPNVVLEAMAAGCPVVATNVSGIPEAVVDGETGALVSPGNPEQLSAALGRMLIEKEAAQRMGAAGRRRAEEEFSLDRSTARLRAAFGMDANV
ncbi:MAG TPA: glycosyltransferase [Vicinamibacterales bacterium]|jgi:glycosyltransferase involved in cell wall biosynthesis|nr:glycosyltransferase [Vicinamibacterales bacterium]